jgi:uncharacterized repeat protein (TIGR01451 family)
MGVLAAAGAVVVTAVHGQVNQFDDANANRLQSFGSPDHARYGSMLLADGSDSFSAARKMQGSAFYTNRGTPANSASNYSDALRYISANNAAASDGASPSDTATQSVSAPLQNTVNTPSASGGSQTVNMPAASGGGQSVYPSAETNASSSMPSSISILSRSSTDASSNPDNAANAEDSGNGMTALQRRLAALRKTSAIGGAPVADHRSGVAESGTAATPAPTSPAAPVPTQRMSTTGPQNGPVAPTMPELHAAPVSPSASAVQLVENPTINSEAPGFSVASAPASPVVGGPLSTSGRAIDADSTLSTSQIPRVGQTPGDSQRPAAVSSPARSVVGPAQNYSGGDAANSASALKSTAAQTISPLAETGNRAAGPAHATGPELDGVLFARQSPLMSVQTTGPRSISVGKEAAYTVSIANAGEFAAQDVAVSIRIPAWTEVVSAKSAGGAAGALPEQPGDPIVWRLAKLEPRSKEQFVVRLIPHESRPFDLSVQWTCSPAASQAMVEVKEPKLAMSLDGPPEVVYGQTKVYRLTISNPGTGDAEHVVLMLAPVDGGNDPPTRREIGTIRAGDSKPIEMELSARQTGTLSIKAAAVAEGNLRAEVNEEILVRRPGLKLSTDGPEVKFANAPGTYNIVVANPGNAAAKSISVAALLPPGAKYVSSTGGQLVEGENKVVWTISNLRPGGEQELELRCALTTPGANRVKILATAGSDLSDSADLATDVQAVADLKLEVVDPAGPLAVGDEMIYEVHIRNRGSKAAENVDVVAFFSRGMEPVAAQGEEHQIAPGQIVFKPIESIAPASEVVLKIKARADQPGHHIFRTEVNCPSAGAKLASEETTLFYGDGREAARTAAKPRSGGTGAGQSGSGDGNSSSPLQR